jgi:hypothetical protein
MHVCSWKLQSFQNVVGRQRVNYRTQWALIKLVESRTFLGYLWSTWLHPAAVTVFILSSVYYRPWGVASNVVNSLRAWLWSRVIPLLMQISSDINQWCDKQNNIVTTSHNLHPFIKYLKDAYSPNCNTGDGHFITGDQNFDILSIEMNKITRSLIKYFIHLYSQ